MKNNKSAVAIQYILYIFNAAVVLFFAAFMCITQIKINNSLLARTFLASLDAPPWPVHKILFLTIGSFLLLIIFSNIYQHCVIHKMGRKYIVLFLEICTCLIVMRSINMAYNGVVLIIVADLVSGYRGKNQRIILILAMLGLYLIASYNLAVFQLKMVPLEAYISYYDPLAQGVLKAACNIFTAFNMIVFVLYIIILVQNQHQEKERIKSLNEELNIVNEKLRLYAIEAESMAETRERNRLAREIHDTLGHALTGIIAGIDACIATIDEVPEFTKKQLPVINNIARHGMNDVRRSVKKLRPDNLERFSLKEALLQMTREFSITAGIDILLNCNCWPQSLREDEEEIVYRVIQEGITNANRHGKARHVLISIQQQVNWLNIMIKDDGRGCNNIVKGFGLRHMQERIELLKGRLEYRNDSGFIIEVFIPIGKRGDE